MDRKVYASKAARGKEEQVSSYPPVMELPVLKGDKVFMANLLQADNFSVAAVGDQNHMEETGILFQQVLGERGMFTVMSVENVKTLIKELGAVVTQLEDGTFNPENEERLA